MTRFLSTTAIAISLLFAFTLLYNGVGHSLQWLSLAGVILLAWLSSSVAKLDLTRTNVAWGWLPTVTLAYVAWLFINPFVSTYPYVSLATAMQLALSPLVFLGWLIARDEDKDRTWRTTWAALSAIGVMLSIWGIADFVVLRTRAHGPLIDANAYGALVNLFLIPTAFTYLRTPPSARGANNPRLQLCIVGLLSLALCMTLSRGALLSLLAISPGLLWLNRRFPALRWRAALLLLVFICAYGVTKTVPSGADRDVATLLQAPAQQLERDSNIQARFLMWRATWKIITDANPLIGTGLGTYKNYYATYRDTRETMSSGNLAHNDYLQALQEGGLILLAFLLVLTIGAPVFLLYKGAQHRPDRGSQSISDDGAGFLFAIIAVSLHALVNFTHYVAPIALLTGLYLAHGWETVRSRQRLGLLPFDREHIKPGFLKGLVIALVAIPVIVLAVDGVAFKLFSTKEPWISHFSPPQRFAIINTLLSIRPSNPKPRVFLIQQLLDAASRTETREGRERVLAQAETEAKALITTAPALASGQFFLGTIRVLRGTPNDLLLARVDLEHAVELVPPAMAMRLELVKLYERLGLQREALETIRKAKEWFMHESDYTALAAFAEEASRVASNQQDREEAEFWKWVYSRLKEQGLTG